MRLRGGVAGRAGGVGGDGDGSEFGAGLTTRITSGNCRATYTVQPIDPDTDLDPVDAAAASICTSAMRLLLPHWASLALLISSTAAGAGGGDASANLTTHSSRNLQPSTFSPPQHWRNVNLVRQINVERSYAKETLNVVVENVAGQAQRDYFLPFEAGTRGRIGGLEVRDKKEPDRRGFHAQVLEGDEMG